MKKFYAIAALGAALVASDADAQSQRYILAEEFTQASCGPCAAQNPAFNAVLNANESKIIGLKYQVWWPGFDPMYLHNSPEVNTRVAYYNVTGVPNVRVDGTAYAGAPSGVTQSFVDNRYNTVTSPYTINLSHSFDPVYNQMTITADITCTQSVTGTMKLMMAVIEREINFTSPPGTNGELDFYGVMKKMVPDDQGVTVTAMNSGETQTITHVVDVPWYVYNCNQLAAVAFIQSNTKAVQQAAYSVPQNNVSPTVDMQITNVTGVPSIICAGSFDATVTLKNNQSTVLTSCDVNYSIDNGPAVTTQWTGNLAQNQNSIVTLTGISAGNGSHSLRIWTSNLNAGVDISPINNNNFKKFSYAISATAPPVVEDFAPVTFPPAEWIINDNNNDNIGWSRVANAGGFGTSTSSARMNFYASTNGRIDEMIVKKIDFQGMTGTASLEFNLAYAQYQAENDRLEVQVSTNCGATWTSLFNKAGATLMTAPPTTANFVPSATQWRAETVDLTSYLGNAEVLIKFKATSNYGNNLFVDDININTTVGIAEEALENAVKLYPTLSTGIINLDANFAKAEDLKVFVYNTTGQQIVSESYGQTLSGKFILDLGNQANGNYTVKIMAGDAAIMKNISIAK